MIVIGLWNVGVNVVVYIAALGTVRRDLHDAAALDGAGSVARFRYVTWPALLPITLLPGHRQCDRGVAGLHAELLL